MYEDLTQIATNLAEILSSQRGIEFKRSISVEDNCGGNIDVSLHQVTIHPFFLTEGNPVAVIDHVLDVCQEFDHRYQMRTDRAIIDLKHQLRYCLRELSRHDPASLQSIIEEELSIGEDSTFTLTLIEG